MTRQEVLSQDELDTLLEGVENGNVDTQSSLRLRDGVARPVDLTANDRIVRGRMPTLEMIANRFCRNLRVSLFNLLHRYVNVSFGAVRVLKLSEYMATLTAPTSLNMVRMTPLHGNGLFLFDCGLVYSLVETYFGGEGRPYSSGDSREFTATETRVVQLALDRCLESMNDAWSPVSTIEFEYVSSEVNPQFATIVSPTEMVVVLTFTLQLDAVGGELHVALPYASLEPIRDLLDAGVQSDRDVRDDRWLKSILAELECAEVELHSTLLRTQLSLSRLLALKPGDVIPIELPDRVSLCAEGVPLYRGRFGVANGSNAIELTEPVVLDGATTITADSRTVKQSAGRRPAAPVPVEADGAP